MLGHFGFSYIGLLYLLMLFLPNLFWARHKPQGYSSVGESKLLVFCERLGEVCVCGVSLIFSDFNLKSWSRWSIFLLLSFLLMLLYEAWWIRYFRSNKTLQDFYCSFLGIPVAGATLPVLAFFLLGIYGKNIWMILSSMLLGIGHIGIHLQHRVSFRARPGFDGYRD